jgi:hypothetical protein
MRSHLLLLCLVSMACRHAVHEPAAGASTSARIANLRAYAKLYGLVRWFHPGDVAAAVDWDRFAIDGVRTIVDAPDARARRAVLVEMWKPVAPTVEISAAGEPRREAAGARFLSGGPTEVVAWQHRGFGDSTFITAYASKRRHRDRVVPAPGVPFAALWQAVDAPQLRGKRVRLRGKLRTAGHARGQLWLRVDRADSTGFFDNMDQRPVVSAAWKQAEIVGTVASDATRIVFGTLMASSWTVWYDDLELAFQAADAWVPVPIRDPGFEAEDPLVSWSPGIGRPRFTSIKGWNVTRDRTNPASGMTALWVEVATNNVTEELFPDSPAADEVTDVDLGGGLRARVPLALYSKDGRTLGDPPEGPRPAVATGSLHTIAGFDAMAAIADVVVVWNVLDHFWPYWRDVSVDWNDQLDRSLRDALDDRNVDDHVTTLKRLLVATPDGHASVTCLGESPQADPPFSVDVIEGEVVVTASADTAIVRGDVLTAVDDVPAAALISAAQTLVSGSPQWRLRMACRQFATGPAGSWLRVRLRRGGESLTVRVARSDGTADRAVDEPTHAPIEQYSDGVYYIDLSRVPMAELDGMMSSLAAAPGVIFDVRHRPSTNHAVLSHLGERTINFSEAMYIPHIIRPSHSATSIPSWGTSEQPLPPLQPRIAGRVAFLTGPDAISYAESVMGLVAHHRLGAIVGSPTAGSNGNIAEITTPTGCRVRFTGLRVTRQDGSRFHLVGVQPTIPVTPTIAGVREGRDEVRERALTYVRDR